MTTCTVALAQIDIALGEPAANIATARRMIAAAAERHADILVLPELWSTGYALEQAQQLADNPGAGVFATLAELALEHRIAIVGSTLARHAGQPTNTATFYTAHGLLAAEYSKIHLFGLMQENQFLAPGQEMP